MKTFYMVMAAQRFDTSLKLPEGLEDWKFTGPLQWFIPVFPTLEEANEWMGDSVQEIIAIEVGDADNA